MYRAVLYCGKSRVDPGPRPGPGLEAAAAEVGDWKVPKNAFERRHLHDIFVTSSWYRR